MRHSTGLAASTSNGRHMMMSVIGAFSRKQVDVLDRHEDVVLCASKTGLVDAAGNDHAGFLQRRTDRRTRYSLDCGTTWALRTCVSTIY